MVPKMGAGVGVLEGVVRVAAVVGAAVGSPAVTVSASPTRMAIRLAGTNTAIPAPMAQCSQRARGGGSGLRCCPVTSGPGRGAVPRLRGVRLVRASC